MAAENTQDRNDLKGVFIRAVKSKGEGREVLVAASNISSFSQTEDNAMRINFTKFSQYADEAFIPDLTYAQAKEKLRKIPGFKIVDLSNS